MSRCEQVHRAWFPVCSEQLCRMTLLEWASNGYLGCEGLVPSVEGGVDALAHEWNKCNQAD